MIIACQFGMHPSLFSPSLPPPTPLLYKTNHFPIPFLICISEKKETKPAKFKIDLTYITTSNTIELLTLNNVLNNSYRSLYLFSWMKMLRKCEILTWCIPEYIFNLHIRDVPFLSPKFNSTLLFFPSEPMKEYIVQYKEIWIPESRRFLLVEWKIREFFSFRIRISNPSDNDWHLKFTFRWQKFASSTWNPESTASNSESKIWLDSLTWGEIQT